MKQWAGLPRNYPAEFDLMNFTTARAKIYVRSTLGVPYIPSLGPRPFPLIMRGRKERVWGHGLAAHRNWNVLISGFISSVIS